MSKTENTGPPSERAAATTSAFSLPNSSTVSNRSVLHSQVSVLSRTAASPLSRRYSDSSLSNLPSSRLSYAASSLLIGSEAHFAPEICRHGHAYLESHEVGPAPTTTSAASRAQEELAATNDAVSRTQAIQLQTAEVAVRTSMAPDS